MTGKVLVVTGGSTGIGAAVARMAATQGYAVGLSYRSSEEPARQVVEEIRRAGGRALAMKADSASPAETAAFFAAVDRELGRVTALVNNAGITGPISCIEALDPAALDQVLAINVKGCFLALREAILRMATDLGGQGGAVVNVSASRELAPRGIRVNAVNPGLIDTEIHAKAGVPDRAERFRPMIPMARAGSAEEVADVILWLLSDQSSYVTGALVPIGGGR
jgi:NAD(P)-dependent dehydrogenase (short-subunit alcohol dehydrogenase family)